MPSCMRQVRGRASRSDSEQTVSSHTAEPALGGQGPSQGRVRTAMELTGVPELRATKSRNFARGAGRCRRCRRVDALDRALAAGRAISSSASLNWRVWQMAPPAHAQNNLAMMVVASTGRGVVRAWQWQTSRGVAVLAATRRLLSSPVTPDFNTSVNVAEHSISLRKARAKRAATIDELKVSFVCTRVARQAVRGWVDLLT